MEAASLTPEQPSAIGRLRFDLIESETARLMPWADEMGDPGFIVSRDDADSVIKTTLREIDNQGMFTKPIDPDQIQSLAGEIGEYLLLSGKDITITGAVDITLMHCLHDRLIEKPKKEGE